jgi:extracellular factor (EF) 3-hydroxypalmitic acid methyl ester biosynthesis protein
MKEMLAEIITEKRDRVVRQNRFDLIGDQCFITVNNEKFEVIDCTSFGIAFRAHKDFEKDKMYGDCKVSFVDNHIGDISIRVIRAESAHNYKKIACEIIGTPLEMEKISGIKSALQITMGHQDEVNKFTAIPEEFRRLVCEMKVWLLSLKGKVDNLDKNIQFNRVSDKQNYENTIANVIGSYIVNSFEPLYVKLDTILKSSDQQGKDLAFEFFRSQMIDLLLDAPFHNRAYTKPLGYAGDYQMMNQIYSYEGLGDNLFAKCLHLYFISAPESRAVRNRAGYLYDQIIKAFEKKKDGEKFRLLSVACGPAFEMQNFIYKHPELALQTKFCLLDQDMEALQHAQRKIMVIERDLNIKLDVELIHKPIKHVIAKGISGEFDLIYSAGLFDYFTDPVAHMAARRLFDALDSDGKLIIGNFSNASMGQLTMDIALDWHLIYRSPDELRGLFAEIGSSFSIESEEEGINLFCHIDK